MTDETLETESDFIEALLAAARKSPRSFADVVEVVDLLRGEGWQLAPPGYRIIGPEDEGRLVERIAVAFQEAGYYPDGMNTPQRKMARIAVRALLRGDET